MLTQEYLQSLFLYDPKTGIFTRKIKRNDRHIVGEIAGCLNPSGYINIIIDKKSYKAHRLAWLYMYAVFPTNQVDHIDGNKSNNSIENLRIVDNSGNKQNTKSSYSNNRNGLLGVAFNKRLKKFSAQININKKRFHLGYFENSNEAHEAYLQKKKELHSFSTI